MEYSAGRVVFHNFVCKTFLIEKVLHAKNREARRAQMTTPSGVLNLPHANEGQQFKEKIAFLEANSFLSE